MKLAYTPYKKEAGGGGHGYKIDWILEGIDPKKPYVIFQNITSTIETSDGDKSSYEYTEAWQYNPRRPKRKLQDAFVVGKAWREDLDGKYTILAEAWLERGRIPSDFRVGTTRALTGSRPWGTLRGRWKQLEAPKEAVRREFVMTWANNGKPSSALVGGRDLKFSAR